MAKFNAFSFFLLAIALMFAGPKFSDSVDVLIVAASVWFAADWVVSKLSKR